MLRVFRGACLICFCILGAAAVVAVLRLLAHDGLQEATGCHSTEVLSRFTCGEGWSRRPIEIILNSPLLFFFGALLTILGIVSAFDFSFSAMPST